MSQRTSPSTQKGVGALLRKHGIYPTAQRIAVAAVLFSSCRHFAAEELFQRVISSGSRVSRATVYNTLGLLAAKGAVREVIADPDRIFYDPNTHPHHHLYDETTGELTDIDESEVSFDRLPALPEGFELERVDVIVRLRPKSAG